MITLVILAITALLAGFVQGLTGFAFAIIFMAVMQNFLPYAQALALSTGLGIIVDSFNLYLHRKHIAWRKLPIPIIAKTICVFLSIYFLKYTANFPYWHKLLGIVFILLAVHMLRKMSHVKKNVAKKANVKNAVLFCGTSGAVDGLFGVGGPFSVMYFLGVTENKSEYLGTLAASFFFSGIFAIAGRISAGMYTIDVVQYIAVAVWFVIGGILLGYRMLNKINGDKLRMIVYLLMIADGIYMLLA